MTWDRFTPDEAQAFEAALRSKMGTPWRHMGRAGCGYGHQTGLDCAGLIIFAAMSVGRCVLDPESYSRNPDGTLEARITEHLGAPSVVPAAGHLVLLRLPRLPRHVGYVTSSAMTLIHSYSGGRRCVMEHAFDESWRNRVFRSWAL